MKDLKRTNTGIATSRHLKVLQFGGGNFLRGFADWIIDIMNEQTNFSGDIQIIQSISNANDNSLQRQNGLYHVAIKGLKNGNNISDLRLITSVAGAINPTESPDDFLRLAQGREIQFVISNTTEAGIVFKNEPFEGIPATFPGKLTMLLYHRYRAGLRGLVMLPCELLEQNGNALREIVLQYCDGWNLPVSFREWIVKENVFCNTLVDRIVPGFSETLKEEIATQTGYYDNAAVMAEPFYSWVIEGPSWVSEIFPVKKCGLQVEFVPDIKPYHTRKVRILNGAHTAMMPVAYLHGFRTVRDSINDESIGYFIEAAIETEIIPTLDFPGNELRKFSSQVIERFKNPFIEHQLSAIALNSISKFKVRVLPTILEYFKRTNNLPERLIHSFACLILFYKGEWKGQSMPLKDTEQVLSFFDEAWRFDEISQVIHTVLSNTELWGFDLSTVPGLENALVEEVATIKSFEESF
jgi:tagaturonate reductase